MNDGITFNQAKDLREQIESLKNELRKAEVLIKGLIRDHEVAFYGITKERDELKEKLSSLFRLSCLKSEYKL